jgi:spore germination cell wall hydrolase CwlJ-like protein
MSRISGSAGLAAALFLAAFGTFHATPSKAWQVDLPAPTPAVITSFPAPAAQAPGTQDPALDQPVSADPQPVAHAPVDKIRDRTGAAQASSEQACLATAVYFEAKGEPLKGQLGVAQVILNRTKSGRFPRSVCGVVKQPGQFSFVRGGRLPGISHGGGQWKTALAIAALALSGDAPAPAPKALFFHARSVAPGWHLTRVAAIGNHVFYR